MSNTTSKVYIQYGCGMSSPEGWLNYDASPTLRFERVPVIGSLYTKNGVRFPNGVNFGDITKGLPLPDESCDGIYCSHVLEHLSLTDFRKALINTYKILKPNAYFRLVLPDLSFYIDTYTKNDSPTAAHTFMKDTYLGIEKRPKGISGLLTTWLGNSQHLWMWDYNSMAHELSAAGFKRVRRAKIGDSSDKYFSEVEMVDRWENCLGVECTK